MATETLETAEPEGAAAPAQDKEELCSEAPRPAKGGKTEHKREDDEENNDVEVAGGEEEIVARGDDEEEGADEKATADESHDDDSKGRSKKKKKRSRAVKKSSDEADGKKDPVTPNSERPTRERKSVERYSAPLSRTPSGKGLLIEKGRGTQLKDIPNVAFKLSKRKADENLQILHTILFGKKAKVHSLKRNIGQFSGYVWVENEEKQRAKVKEKLDKCVKDRLIDFCDMLNIPINKAIAKKEELLVKLLEFLESPHSTTDVLLAEKGQKRKRKVTGNKPVVSGEASSMTSEKKKQTPDVSKKQKISSQIVEKEEVDDKDENNGMKDDPDAASDDNLVSKEESADEKSKSEEEDDTPKETVSKSSSKRKAKEISVVKTKDALESGKKISSAKSSKKSSALASKKSAVDERDHKTPRSKSEGSVSKKQKVEKSKQDQTVNPNVKTSSKKESKSSAKISIKEQGKGKSSKKSKGEPSREEMHAVVVDILKKVDFNTATLSDILRQLGTHFDVDLMHRKAEVKDIITEVINNMTDEDDDDDDDEEAEENAEVDGE